MIESVCAAMRTPNAPPMNLLSIITLLAMLTLALYPFLKLIQTPLRSKKTEAEHNTFACT